MTLDLLNDLGEKSGISNRRFLLGIFFPIFITINAFAILLLKQIPTDLLSLSLILIISFFFSIIQNDLSPKICWSLSLTSKKYSDFLLNNIENLFLHNIEEMILKNKLDEKKITEKIKNDYLELFTNNAKVHYFKNYFSPGNRFDENQIIFEETRFLFVINLILSNFFLISFISYLSLSSLTIGSFVRNKIQILNIPVLSLLSISLMFLVFFWISIQRNFWISLIQSTPVPFEESDYEVKYRTSILDTFSSFLQENPIKNIDKEQEIRNDAYKNLIQSPIIQKALEGNFKSNLRDNMQKDEMVKLLSKYKDELELTSTSLNDVAQDLVQARKLKPLRTTLKKSEIEKIIREEFKFINDSLQNDKKIPEINYIIILKLNNLIEILASNIFRIETSFRELINLLFKNQMISKEELHELELIRGLRNNLVHNTRFKLNTDEIKQLDDLIMSIKNTIGSIMSENYKEDIVKVEKKSIVISDGGFLSDRVPILALFSFLIFSISIITLNNLGQILFSNFSIFGQNVNINFTFIYYFIFLSILTLYFQKFRDFLH